MLHGLDKAERLIFKPLCCVWTCPMALFLLGGALVMEKIENSVCSHILLF